MRVVSLVPSATDMLHALDALDLLVGRDHDSSGLPKLDSIPCLTKGLDPASTPAAIDAAVRDAQQDEGTINHLDAEQLRQLQPDLILTQQCCGVCSPLHQDVLAAVADLSPAPKVLCFDPTSIDQVLDDIEQLAKAIRRPDAATTLLATLRAVYWQAQDLVGHYLDGPRTAVIEWASPLYLAGHWTPGLIRQAGGTPIGPEPGAPSTIVECDQLVAARPERLILAPCGVALADTAPHVQALQDSGLLKELTGVPLAVLDGRSTFSRPGPGLIDTFAWLTAWLMDRPEHLPQSVQAEYLDAEDVPSAR